MNYIKNSIHKIIALVLLWGVLGYATDALAQNNPPIEDYLLYPQITALTSNGGMLAWVMNEQGRRNIYVSSEKGEEARKITSYKSDDGQEITNVSVSADGKWVVYVRGGGHGGNWSATASVNPESKIIQPGVSVWSVPITGGKPIKLGNGSYPRVSPNSDEVIFSRSGNLYIAPIDGSINSKKLFATKGTVRHAQWSPSGDKVAFSVSRTTHAFIGVFSKGKKNIDWVSPSFDRDTYPNWSPDGKHLAFIRTPGTTKELDSILVRKHAPWEIRVASLATLESERIYKAPETQEGSVPTTHGRYNLNWVRNDRIVYLSYEDGWPHLYGINPDGSNTVQLTKGDYMVEQISVSSDLGKVLFAANTGDLKDDIDRRHIGMCDIDKFEVKMLTSGEGIESSPFFVNSQKYGFLSSTYDRPVIPAMGNINSLNDYTLLAENRIPSEIPTSTFVQPKQVVFQSEDGYTVHGQLFEKDDGKTNKPAVVFVHGGPQRQILLAWDHSPYYAHSYALNQYFANLGYVVLSVNYRLGIGYGYHFHKPPNSHRWGGSEYNDVLAGGKYLQELSQVDPSKVGIYGGSYGGYLTAMGLARNSDVFAVGVDIHGVHTRVPSSPHDALFEKAPDAAKADQVAWESSPIAYVDSWKSPVLLIHGDEDRNVGFGHSVDLLQRLRKRNVPVQSLVIPDDTHHWLLYRNLIRVSKATVEFMQEHLD